MNALTARHALSVLYELKPYSNYNTFSTSGRMCAATTVYQLAAGCLYGPNALGSALFELRAPALQRSTDICSHTSLSSAPRVHTSPQSHVSAVTCLNSHMSQQSHVSVPSSTGPHFSTVTCLLCPTGPQLASTVTCPSPPLHRPQVSTVTCLSPQLHRSTLLHSHTPPLCFTGFHGHSLSAPLHRSTVTCLSPPLHGSTGLHSHTVSEKWFHVLNSQNKFSHQRQNKILIVCTVCSLCEWRNNSSNSYQC